MQKTRKAPREGDGQGGFEASLKRLEEIVEKLEQGSVPIDEAMQLYEEGVSLSRECLKRLSQAELKLKRLGKDAEGNFELFKEGIEQ